MPKKTCFANFTMLEQFNNDSGPDLWSLTTRNSREIPRQHDDPEIVVCYGASSLPWITFAIISFLFAIGISLGIFALCKFIQKR